MQKVTSHPQSPDPRQDVLLKSYQPKICFVGGGASAIYTAYTLFYDHGLCDITIFERGDTASKSAQSYVYDKKNNYALDLGTIFIPASSCKIKSKNSSKSSPYWDIDWDIWSPMKELIDKYDLKLTRQNGSFLLDCSKKERTLILKAFEFNGWDIGIINSITNPQVKKNREKLKKECIKVINMLEPLYNLDCYGIDEIYKLGICNKGEKIIDWGKRHDCEMVTWFLMVAADMAGMGPTCIVSSAASVLRLTEKFRMPYFALFLTYLGVNKSSDCIKDYPFIQSLLYHGGDCIINELDVVTSPTYYTFKNGYQSLWNNMIDDITSKSNGSIKFYLNTPVKKVTKCGSESSDSVNVETANKGDFNFDYVFISSRRDSTLELLDEKSFSEEHDLYLSASSETIDYYAALYKLDKDKKQWFSKDGIYPIYPYSKHIGTPEITNIYQCEPFYAYVFNDGEYIVAFGLVDDKADLPIEKCRELLFNHLINDDKNSLGIKNLKRKDLLHDQKWDLGSQFLPNGEINNCYDTLYKLQGKNGVFFIGETVAGFTVPNQFDFVKKFSKQWVDTMMIKKNHNSK